MGLSQRLTYEECKHFLLKQWGIEKLEVYETPKTTNMGCLWHHPTWCINNVEINKRKGWSTMFLSVGNLWFEFHIHMVMIERSLTKFPSLSFTKSDRHRSRHESKLLETIWTTRISRLQDNSWLPILVLW